jgi:hypothetical protein
MEMLMRFLFNFVMGVKGSAVGFTGHNLFLDCRDEVKHTLGVIFADVLEEGFIKESFGNVHLGALGL